MISCVEPSGDMHGAALVKACAELYPQIKFFGLGGEEMARAGVEIRANISQVAVMGFSEILGSLRRILKVRSMMAETLIKERPAALVLIDGPDFNFYLAKAAKKVGVKVIYYICPQLWAWRPGRLKLLRELTHRRAVILPFEKPFYDKRGLSVDEVGHPLFDELNQKIDSQKVLFSLGLSLDSQILAILPGSRKKVLERLIGPMLQAAALVLKKRPQLIAVLPKAATIETSFLEQFLARAPKEITSVLKVVEGRSQEILAVSRLALLASGTSSVEGAILGLPMIVCYKVSAFSWFLASRLVKLPFVTIANLIAGREVVPEFLQNRLCAPQLAESLLNLWDDGPLREKTLSDLALVRAALGGPGASRKVARIVAEETANFEERYDEPSS
jgi:lipid-A-disaccharide synthase